MKNSVKSRLISILDIINEDWRFNIPIYQRLYVWRNEQIETLLSDLLTAYKLRKEIYYLGGVLVVANGDNERLFDLIDGQQRFTTLWLLCLELKHSLSQFIADKHGEMRMSFSIRKEVEVYFKSISELRDITGISETNDDLDGIHNARMLINKAINGLSEEGVISFSSYLLSNIKLIFTEVPTSTDLNKLFEVINNRGEQLQHHEILKSIMLRHISNDTTRIKYAKLWDACSVMNRYVEAALKELTQFNYADLYDNQNFSTGNEELASAKNVLSFMGSRHANEKKRTTLLSILRSAEGIDNYEIEEEQDLEEQEMQEESNTDVRSIVNFSMFLQHTLRIYLFQKGTTDIEHINDKELLTVFSRFFVADEKEVKAFIELLWELRYKFDKHIIKWVKIDDDEEHAIQKLSKQKNKGYRYLTRILPEDNDGFALLQSMLYHTQEITTHYWLTPLLNKVYYTDNREELYQYLLKLDSKLFCTNSEMTLRERSWQTIRELNLQRGDIDIDEYYSNKGTNFSHYLFYKLEFALWHQQFNKNNKWRSFKFTAKNSVEHISPQTPQNTDRNRVSKAYLNSFGNLALVSRSINSEYSNLPYNEKKTRFENKKRSSDRLDSLKMDCVYKNDIWNDNICMEHQKEMIALLERYYNSII